MDSICTLGAKIFWIFVFCSLIGSVGQGPITLDITRLALIALVAVIFLRIRKNISPKIAITSGSVLLATLIVSGIISHSPYIVALGITIAAIFLLAYAIVCLEKKQTLIS